MKVILLCSAMQEGIGKYFGLKEENLGGWISGTISGLKKYNDIDLSFAAFHQSSESNIQSHDVNNVHYYYVQYSDSNILKQFFSENSFDIYHLFGAENAFSYDIFPYLPLDKTLGYIQGIMSECIYHYKANCDEFCKTGFLFNKYLDMNLNILKKQANKEYEVLSKCRYIAGRTDWDKAFLFKIHSKAKYYYLSESLRNIFYEAEKWNYETCTKHSIFVTQAGYPIKAAHMIIEIVRILKTHYDDVKCTICGTDLMHSSSLATKLNISYASFIQKLVKEYHLEENINFVGGKNGEEIANLMTHSNVFLSASSIENSPNSLQEAMLLGVPCVSSYVGGVQSLLSSNNEVVTYPFDDPMMAAYQISKIFEDKEYAESLSVNGMKRAECLTNREKNAEDLYQIYNDMAKTL